MKKKNKPSKAAKNSDTPYELFILAFTLIACAAVILYICFMREPIVIINNK